ncbi:MAG: hypothetical protein U0470_13180 [Anaerolineae bacterium]
MNVGIAPGTFELRFQPLGSCDPPPVAQTVGVGVGEEVPLDLMRASVGSGDLAIIEGDQPFAAVVANADDDQSTALAVASRPAGVGPIPSTALAAAVPLYPGTTRVRVDIVNAGTAPLVPRLSLYGPAGRAAGPAAPPVTGAAVCPGAHATLSVTTTLAAGPPRAQRVWIDAAPSGAGRARGHRQRRRDRPRAGRGGGGRTSISSKRAPSAAPRRSPRRRRWRFRPPTTTWRTAGWPTS